MSLPSPASPNWKGFAAAA
ncbi:hypothetical protein GHO29_04695 [Pseudomonas helleri]|uniref:Uncharacterized protein n=1 Tax=Pseudomonas helleri TaxID=1608996 RepID=A0A6A7YQI1_9PSED|nr:hypothetical protein [Pseudomonas helleri]MQT79211.1 hypothetical protein [Pseudomonas helleri]MQU15174.1 hypothetical protein [Pseudomonas helleri]MQU25778.1 hypothetical protein [Pseudomonas helleri]